MKIRQATLTFLLLFLTLAAANLSAQPIFNEDFSSASGPIPPSGWTVTNLAGHTAGSPAQWQFFSPPSASANVTTWVTTLPMVDPIAISNSDAGATGLVVNTVLTSPPFGADLVDNVFCEFDYAFRQFGASQALLEVFDGSVWNVHTNLTANDPASVGVNSHVEFDITTLAANAVNANVRFHHTAGWDWTFAVDNVEIYGVQNFSLDVTAITSPATAPGACNAMLTSSEDLTVELTNNGLDIPDTDDILIDAYLNGVTVFSTTQNLTSPLLRGGQFTSTWPGALDMTGPGSQLLTVTAYSSADPAPLAGHNSTALKSFNNAIAPGYFENFETVMAQVDPPLITSGDVPLNWENAQDDTATFNSTVNGDWGATQGSLTLMDGPLGDHTQMPGTPGIYMHIGDWTPSFDNFGDIELRSPCLNTSLASNIPVATFFYHSAAPAGSMEDNPLNIDIINETFGGMITTNVIPTIEGQGMKGWRRVIIDLSAFVPDIVRVQFRSSNFSSFNAYDPVAIDDFSFLDLPQLPMGQAPRPGLAVFDINNSVNSLGDPVSEFGAGPYFAPVQIGTDINFSWSGLPNQYVQCWGGPLFVNAANYPGIGQMDTGDGTINMLGIPGGLFWVGNGAFVGMVGATIFDIAFFTDSAGTGGLSFHVPDFFPLGMLGTFQLMVQDPALGFAQSTISNAISVSFVP
jgi:hypothetical protein